MTSDLAAARWAECHRRMVAAGISQSQFAFHDTAFMRQVLEAEATGEWSPFGSDVEDVPVTAAVTTSAPPAASAPGLPPVANPAAREGRSRAIWAGAVAAANAEVFAQGDDPAHTDPKADAVPAGSAARSRSAWGRAVAEANSELIRRGGRIGEA
jgi:hypothetical protein